MMEKLEIRLKKERDDSYPVLIGQGLFSELGQWLKKNSLAKKYVIISDSRVSALFGEELLSELNESGIDADMLIFPEGEKSKNPKVWQSLIENMLKLNIGRDGGVIALGGGVVGDLAGFVSASYLRGIPWIQVPTTLLAMVDASIGGKVGIDLKAGKNLVGAFWQPKAVFIDLGTLRTLSKKQLLNGMAEVVKAGLIRDKALFLLLEREGEKIFAQGNKALKEAIIRSIRVKAEVVERDEREVLGERKILNYGHTIGHSLEALTGYELLHGIAVSLGMRVAGRVALELGILAKEDYIRQNKLLDDFGFPPIISAELGKKLKTKIGREKFFEFLYKDKKIRGGKLEMVLLSEIGKVASSAEDWTISVSRQVIEEGLREILR